MVQQITKKSLIHSKIFVHCYIKNLDESKFIYLITIYYLMNKNYHIIKFKADL